MLSMIGSLAVALMVFFCAAFAADKLATSEGRDMSFDDRLRAFGFAALVGVANFIAPKSPGAAAVGYIALICLVLYLAVWWHEEGSEWSEMLPFALMVILSYFPMKASAASTSVMVENHLVYMIMMIIPSLLTVGVLGFFVADYFYFRYRLDGTLREE